MKNEEALFNFLDEVQNLTSPLMPKNLAEMNTEIPGLKMTTKNRFEFKEYIEMKNEYKQLESYMQQNTNMDKLQAKVERVNKECN